MGINKTGAGRVQTMPHCNLSRRTARVFGALRLPNVSGQVICRGVKAVVEGEKIGSGEGVPDFGAAADGDADRNMILGPSVAWETEASNSLIFRAGRREILPAPQESNGL